MSVKERKKLRIICNNDCTNCKDEEKQRYLEKVFFKIVVATDKEKRAIGNSLLRLIDKSGTYCEHTIFLIGLQTGLAEGKLIQKELNRLNGDIGDNDR